MQRHLYEYFQLPGHTGFLQETYVTLIDKTDPRAPTERKDYWIHTLKTKAHMGLNAQGDYWAPFLHSYCTIISFTRFGRLVFGLPSVYLDYRYIYFIHLFYFIIRDSICTFLASEMELLMAVVNDVNSVNTLPWIALS